MRILFFGSSQYCLPVLISLQQNFNLAAIITKPDRPVGRKQIPTSTESKIFGQKNKIDVLTPANKNELLSLKDKLEKLNPDIAVVADYGLIIPKEIIDIPKYGTVNIHFSRLPDFRGASPVQFTILRGDNFAWISYMIMDEGMDTGDIIKQTDIIQSTNYPINKLSNITAKELYNLLFKYAAGELPEVINGFVDGKLKPVKQDNSKATYTKILKRQDGYIPWDIINNSIEGKSSTLPKETILSLPLFHGSIVYPESNRRVSLLIERAVRAFTPWPGVWTNIRIMNYESGIKEEKRLKILRSHIETYKNQQPTTHNQQPTTHNLQLDFVQLEGKKPVSWKQFAEGYKIEF